MRNKTLFSVVVGMLFVMLSGCNSGEADVLLRDDFDSYNAKTWGSGAGDAISLSGGTLINKPKQGQKFLASTKKYADVTLEIKLKFNSLSTDSTNFYYLGFQSITPWTHDLCWMTIQDNMLSVSLRKDGGKGFSQAVANLKQDQWYILKIIRQEDRVQFMVDDKVVLESEDAAVIPEAKLPIFLSANSTSASPDSSKAELELDWVQVIGETSGKEKRVSRKESKQEQPMFDEQIGKEGGSFIRVRDGIIHLENDKYICELSLLDGLSWERIYNKITSEDYLAEEDNSPVFYLLRKKRQVNSTDFTATDVQLSESADDKSMQLTLSYAPLKLDCLVEAAIDKSDQMQWSLKVQNKSKRDTKIQAVFPVISRINIGNLIEENSYFYPWRSGIVGQVDCDLTYEYGGMAWMQVISVFCEDLESGLYTYTRDSSGQFKGMIFKKSSPDSQELVQHRELTAAYEVPADIFEFDEGVGLAYYYLPQQIVGNGELTLPTTTMCVYRGDWKHALESYSKWAHTWYKNLDRPQWFKDCFSFLPRHKPSYYSEDEKRYMGTELFSGSEHIVQWAHWWDYMEGRDLPRTILMGKEQPGDFDYNQSRGGLEAFREEVRKTQECGVRFTVYIDHRFCCNETKIGREMGAKWAAIYEPGGKYAGYGGPDDQYVTCYHDSDAWPDYLAKTCGRIIRDTGMDGIYLDELALPFACYNTEHAHNRDHDSIVHIPTFVANMKKARDAMRAENPEAILWTEHAGSDYFTQFIDGSWTQTFYKGAFPFAEKHFDKNSLNYFRFCFPEFKLATWGNSNDGPRRCFFNGIGVDWGVGRVDYLRKTGQVLKENGDAIATLKPEPLVETQIKNVLANKFPIPGKTIYTIYNKTDKEVSGELLEVTPNADYHYVELLHDNEVAYRNELFRIKDVLKPTVAANEVICIAVLPKVIQAAQDGSKINVSLKNPLENGRLVAFADEDAGHLNENSGQSLPLQHGKEAMVDTKTLPDQTQRVILKLFRGDYLYDEVIVNLE